ncbi:hypothetical protein Dimus_029228 [Dionaea muscipula]
MVRSYMDSMMGAANPATIKALRNVPLKQKFASLCRSMAEMSFLTGDILYNAVRIDSQRCRKIDRLMEEVKELKYECDTAFEVSTQMKADVDMVMEENQTLESKNEELKTTLEVEKNKVRTLEDKVKELQTTLEKEKEGQTKKNGELIATYSKYHNLLRKKMAFNTSLDERKRESETL